VLRFDISCVVVPDAQVEVAIVAIFEDNMEAVVASNVFVGTGGCYGKTKVMKCMICGMCRKLTTGLMFVFDQRTNKEVESRACGGSLLYWRNIDAKRKECCRRRTVAMGMLWRI